HREAVARERHQLHRQRDVAAVGQRDLTYGQVHAAKVQVRQSDVGHADDELRNLVVAKDLREACVGISHDAPSMGKMWSSKNGNPDSKAATTAWKPPAGGLGYMHTSDTGNAPWRRSMLDTPRTCSLTEESEAETRRRLMTRIFRSWPLL
uniref:Uncharacterized protein n=1 Tax=Triticum urartu TaxID=4572 RepID=A0A8R7QXT3_TRIUA